MTLSIRQAIEHAKIHLPKDSASFDAEVLLGHLIGKPRSYLFAFNDHLLSDQETQQFLSAIERAKAGEPIAYITGSRGFWDLDLHVTPDVLIPRPDTESVIEAILERCDHHAPIQILDLGTGSGAIALSLKSALINAHIFALDVSFNALKVCQKNCLRNTLKVTLIHGSWLDAIQDLSFDIIVSNPPYIDEGDQHLSDLIFEPYNALVASDNGLSDYRAICAQAHSKLKTDGMLVFEHGFEQATDVSSLMHKANFTRIETIKDFGNNDRVTLGYKQP